MNSQEAKGSPALPVIGCILPLRDVGRDREFYCGVQGLLTEFAEKMPHQELVPRDPLSEGANISFNHHVCILTVIHRLLGPAVCPASQQSLFTKCICKSKMQSLTSSSEY